MGLGQVRWLGGATGAGKTAVASHLAAAFGLHVYSTDAAIARHGAVQAEAGPDAPLLARFRELSWTSDGWARTRGRCWRPSPGSRVSGSPASSATCNGSHRRP